MKKETSQKIINKLTEEFKVLKQNKLTLKYKKRQIEQELRAYKAATAIASMYLDQTRTFQEKVKLHPKGQHDRSGGDMIGKTLRVIKDENDKRKSNLKALVQVNKDLVEASKKIKDANDFLNEVNPYKK